jgi:hypothetical protein
VSNGGLRRGPACDALTGREDFRRRCWEEKGSLPEAEMAKSMQRLTVFAHKGRDESTESKQAADGRIYNGTKSDRLRFWNGQ